MNAKTYSSTKATNRTPGVNKTTNTYVPEFKQLVEVAVINDPGQTELQKFQQTVWVQTTESFNKTSPNDTLHPLETKDTHDHWQSRRSNARYRSTHGRVIIHTHDAQIRKRVNT